MIPEEDTSRFLEEATPWERLSPSTQAYFGTPNQFQARILDFSFDHQKPWDPALTFISPGQYYQKLIEFSIDKFLVFPYHLISELQRYQPIVPFKFYTDMLLRVMATDRAYQTIPNFAAADALRVTGVGRNQFIDAMNKSRAGGMSTILQSRDKRLRSLLPQQPERIPLQPWWVVHPVPTSDGKAPKLPSSQRAAYDRITAAKATGIAVGKFAESDIRGLYNESLIYIAVPLSAQDTVKLLPLDNFVMNRVGGDYLEGLCYKSFISIDESTTVLQLSGMLAIDVAEIAKVLSLFIRLSLAEKVTIADALDSGEPTAKRMAAVYDCNLPATLMLGNLGPTVKSFAVTLFEVGKMPDTGVMEFTTALQMVEAPTDESMKTCHEKCQIIARSLFFLRSLPISSGGVDMIRIENLLDLDDDSRAKMFDRNYAAAVAMAPLTLTRPSLSMANVIHFGPPSPLFHSPWLLLYLHALGQGGPPVFLWPQGEIVTSLPEPFYDYDTARVFKWEAEPIVVSTTTLLITLDDALPSSPVLVQCWEREGETIREVGFPSDEQSVKELEPALGLGSLFGYMKFVTVSGGQRFPVDVEYGMPTESLDLCNHVIEAIDRFNMMGAENITRMKADVGRIVVQLEDFVKVWSCGIGHPVRSLFAADGSIQWI
jgi:hypothetical protein